MRILYCLSLLFFLAGCKTEKKEPKKTTQTETTKTILSEKEQKGIELLDKCIAAHGGMTLWKSFEGLEYNLDDNGKMVYQLTHLKDRRAYLKSKKYEVGFDSEVAWAKPDALEVSGKSAAFYYNLDFYFIGVPFLLKDPGVNAFYAGQTVVNDKTYETLKITFGADIGFTPEDIYYLYIDPSTYLLDILTYSISYIDKESAAVNSAKVYSEYRNIQGMIMPHKMENFEWKDGQMGESKNHLRIFSDIKFVDMIPNKTLFEVPEGAVIEALKESP